jgi:hypothetical protein
MSAARAAATPTSTATTSFVGVRNYSVGAALEVATPARQNADPLPDALLATGRLDQLDSVGRQSPSMVGFAFNNRLLFGGFAGESNSSAGGLNPLNDPAHENLTLLLLDAHRMLDYESAELQKIPAFIELFRQAFPEEARDYEAYKGADPTAVCQSELDKLVNDDSVVRATATFLRTAVTRNTPFDRFLAGEDALSARQRRGAKLFFTAAQDGGAGCFSCHSGPMLNKQPNDPDVAGIGHFVEENFFNLGIGEITHNPDHASTRCVAPSASASAIKPGFCIKHVRVCATPWSNTMLARRLRHEDPQHRRSDMPRGH